MSKEKEQRYLEMMEAHSGLIIKVAHLYADHSEDRRDLQQEIMIQAWRSFDSFSGNSKFSTWLYRVSLNTALSYIKAEKRRKETMNEVNIDESQDVSTERSDILYAAIKNLPEVSRMIITLHLEGYKNPEIAAITGMSDNLIGVKLHRIKTHLVTQLKSAS